MQALVFRYSLPRFAFAYTFGRLTPRAYVSWGGPTHLEEIPEPSLLGDDWTVVRTARTGICGSDVKQIFLDGNFDNPLTALISFPQVLGHEAAGVVERVGPGVKTRRVGERVVLNPWLSCGPRGIDPPCDACQRGQYTLCRHFTDGALPPGMHAGNNYKVTGAYAPLIPAHESQLFPIPDGVSFDQAVLADPFSVCLHAILKAPPVKGALALVYGAGSLGLMTVAILRALYPAARVAIIARYAHQAELAKRLGAEQVICTRDPAQVVQEVANLTGAHIYRPQRGLPWLLRGVDVIYDTIGSAESLEVGIRVANPHAPIVVRRRRARPLRVDPSLLQGGHAYRLQRLWCGGVRGPAPARHGALFAAGGPGQAGPVPPDHAPLSLAAVSAGLCHAAQQGQAWRGQGRNGLWRRVAQSNPLPPAC